MSLRCLSVLLFALAALPSAAGLAPLRICADPDNLPFSDRAGEGFDHSIAVVVAHALNRQPVFVWARSRRAFLREQFNRGACDVLMGVPRGVRGVATSVPYYRSSYVFVTPKKEHLEITSFDDPRLAHRRIGLQVLEEDYAPPSLPLIRNGHAAQLVGFDSFGSGGAQMMRAVATGRIGAAVVWGPVAGYFAQRDHLAVDLAAVRPEMDSSGVPFVFDMCMGVHKQDAALLTAVNAALARSASEIDGILRRNGIPRVSRSEEGR